MTTIRFKSMKARVVRTVRCSVCGKKLSRAKTVECTVNPFNKNEDGTVKTPAEVYQQAKKGASEWWPAKPIFCKAHEPAA